MRRPSAWPSPIAGFTSRKPRRRAGGRQAAPARGGIHNGNGCRRVRALGRRRWTAILAAIAARGSNIYRMLLDELIVLDDIQPADGPYDWAADVRPIAARAARRWPIGSRCPGVDPSRSAARFSHGGRNGVAQRPPAGQRAILVAVRVDVQRHADDADQPLAHRRRDELRPGARVCPGAAPRQPGRGLAAGRAGGDQHADRAEHEPRVKKSTVHGGPTRSRATIRSSGPATCWSTRARPEGDDKLLALPGRPEQPKGPQLANPGLAPGVGAPWRTRSNRPLPRSFPASCRPRPPRFLPRPTPKAPSSTSPLASRRNETRLRRGARRRSRPPSRNRRGRSKADDRGMLSACQPLRRQRVGPKPPDLTKSQSAATVYNSSGQSSPTRRAVRRATVPDCLVARVTFTPTILVSLPRCLAVASRSTRI